MVLVVVVVMLDTPWVLSYPVLSIDVYMSYPLLSDSFADRIVPLCSYSVLLRARRGASGLDRHLFFSPLRASPVQTWHAKPH